jgi:hypothetical protein
VILTNRVLFAFCALVLAAPTLSAHAQSLADVARREEERRKAVATGRVYTNENLGPASEGSAPPAPATAAAPSAAEAAAPAATPVPNPAAGGATEAAGGTVVEADSKRTEAYWRKMMKDLRARLTQSTAALAAQQARLAEIDGGGVSTANAREREVVAAAIPKLQEGIRYQTEEIARWTARAKVEKIPADWIQ